MIGTELPPGMTALKVRPGWGPPAMSYRISLSGVPMVTS